jgi:hypothetical protein
MPVFKAADAFAKLTGDFADPPDSEEQDDDDEDDDQFGRSEWHCMFSCLNLFIYSTGKTWRKPVTKRILTPEFTGRAQAGLARGGKEGIAVFAASQRSLQHHYRFLVTKNTRNFRVCFHNNCARNTHMHTGLTGNACRRHKEQ